MNDMRLVDITPIVNGWNDAVKEKLEEAEALMASGNLTDHNRGAVKEQVANLVSGLADDLMSAPVIDPETLRPVAHIIHGTVPETEDGVFCSECRGFIGMETSYIAEHAAFCWQCGARFEEGK